MPGVVANFMYQHVLKAIKGKQTAKITPELYSFDEVVEAGNSCTLHPAPCTLNPKPSPLNPKP